MPGPPPPPPMAPAAPPPPPLFSAPKGGPDDRGALLKSIRQGAKLKKTVTVDKSAPMIPGKLSSNNTCSNNNNSSSPVIGNSSPSSSPNGIVLGGLFAGGMPKLRPTGKLSTSTLSSSTNNVNNGDNRNTNSKPVTPTKKFNSIQNELKKQLASDSRNRGPPPPAPQRKGPEDTSNQTQSLSAKENGTNSLHLSQTSLHITSTSLQINNSSLHRKTKSNANLSTLDSPDSVHINNYHSNRPVISHGKPNLAPKPPVLNGKPMPPKKLIMNGKPISRAQSMKSPRSPSPQSPESNKFGTVRHISSMINSQGGHSPRPRPPLSSRPSVPPPSVPPQTVAPSLPTQINQMPPPPKVNTVKPPSHAPPPPPGTLPQPPSHAPPPPPPPHKTQPMRPPPAVPAAGNNFNSNPPPPPPRHSSIRDGQPTRRLIVDLDEKFKHLFQSPDRFPRPPPYRNVLKLYLNKQAGSKQQAPLPPHLQPTSRTWDPTSTC